jgi:hypothetical protein
MTDNNYMGVACGPGYPLQVLVALRLSTTIPNAGNG